MSASNTNKTNLQRRRLLKSFGALTASSGLASQLGKFQLINEVLAAPGDYASLDDYKSLVCVFLFGGNDSFNMFLPDSGAAYNNYQALRQNLAIPRSEILSVSGQPYGFYDVMENAHAMYQRGDLALISNVGALIKPLTKQQYENDDPSIPAALFSHSDQQDFWQTGFSGTSATGIKPGWGGSMADMLSLSNSNANVPLSMTVAGESKLLRAQDTIAMALNSYSGLNSFEFLSTDDTWPPWENSRANAWNEILAMQSSHALEQQVQQTIDRTKTRIDITQQALALSMNGEQSLIETPLEDDNGLAEQLRMVARMIYAREHLGMKRQVFFVAMGGYDTHGSQAADHGNHLRTLDKALINFDETMRELDAKSIASYNSVTTFSASEFGRTLGTNGDGTDHGWGGHQLAFGGAVSGGQVIGQLPELAADSDDDIGDAVLPSQSLDQYGATLAKWMGIKNSDLLQIFPNLHNFTQHDLGFLTSDSDDDGIPDAQDNCPDNANPNQNNYDSDAQGDVCDPDDDNDGLPDRWENEHGLNPKDASDAAADNDNDGFSNLQEFEFGTDPNKFDADVDNNNVPDSIDKKRRSIAAIIQSLLLD